MKKIQTATYIEIQLSDKKAETKKKAILNVIETVLLQNGFNTVGAKAKKLDEILEEIGQDIMPYVSTINASIEDEQ